MNLNLAAFAPPCALHCVTSHSLSTSSFRPSPSLRVVLCRRKQQPAQPSMLIPPSPMPEPPLTDEQKGPPDYTWDENYPGTLKPGQVEENTPLDKVLASEVYENMVYEEMDIDERTPHVFTPDEDFLEWLAKEGRLIPRDIDDEDIEVEKQMDGLAEDDLEYGDDDSKTIAYYSRQGSGASAGASSDFGGFAEPTINDDNGF